MRRNDAHLARAPRRHGIDDDPPEVRERIIEILRNMPAWRKMERVGAMWESCRAFAAAGLRLQYPDADDAEIQRRLPAKLLPRDLVIESYEWDPEAEKA